MLTLSWREHLAGAPTGLELPTDRPRPAVRTHACARVTRSVPAAGPTAVPAAFVAMLARYTGQADLVFALALDDQYLVVRVDVDDDPPFGELGARVAAAIDAATHRGPVDPAVFADDEGLPTLQVTLSTGPVGAQREHSPFDLGVTIAAGTATFDFATELFDASTIERMAGHLARLLDPGIDTDLRVSRLPLLSDDDRRQVLVDWNATERDFRQDACIHHLVSEQAARTPEAVAVVDENGIRLTYRQLEESANRLARHLGSLGAERGALVGLCVDRSARMVVGLLGILKSGAGYVPLDPGFPPDRLALMVEDSGLRVVCTEAPLAGTIALPNGVEQILLDRETAAIDERESTDPGVVVAPTDLAYVIYTSGSTGRPKGVMLEHRGVVNFLETMAEEPGLDDHDVLLAVTTLSFDIAGLELFLPLTRGATVVVASRRTQSDPDALMNAFSREGVTVMQATPATWRMLVDAGWTGGNGLKVLCGGEALPRNLARELNERAEEVWNLYGPTETTIWSTVQRVIPDAPVSIGRPIANTSLYVLDRADEPVPIGVAGELCIGGVALARGYHNLPELTAEKFVPDPFSQHAGARMYRTGDLVRYRPDSRIEFLGRIDHQVKVRGFRIELGEIETFLTHQEAIDEAVALVKEDAAGEKRLVAWVKPAVGSVVTSSELRRAMKDALPDYMVPSVVVVMDAMPRTPNGKTDRNRLPAPDWGLIGRDSPYVAARDELEARMVALWERVTGVQQIGVHDDFFDLGVSSLVAARLFAQIDKEFSVDIPVGQLFSTPTVAALTALVRGGAPRPKWKSLVPIQPNGDRRPVFGVHGGAGTILLYGELSRRLGADQPFWGLQAQGLYGGDAVHTTVEQMADAYVEQMREVAPGPYTILGYCYGGLVAVEIARRLRALGDDVDLLVMLNAPSMGYIERYHPVFDDEGVLTDEHGNWLESVIDRTSRRDKLRAAWSDGKVLGVAELFGDRIVRRVRDRLRPAQLRFALRFGRPLPVALRENRYFQIISERAQSHYRPEPYNGGIEVFRAAGLYHADDLGWRDATTGPVRTYEVPGDQPVPRETMKEPAVAWLARELEELLRQRDGAAAATSGRLDGTEDGHDV